MRLYLQLKRDENSDTWDTMWHRTPSGGFTNNITAHNALKKAHKEWTCIPLEHWRISREA